MVNKGTWIKKGHYRQYMVYNCDSERLRLTGKKGRSELINCEDFIQTVENNIALYI